MKATTRNTFSFDGGEYLTSIGASFLISYLYCYYIDRKHANWSKIKTREQRISTINSNKKYHLYWIQKVTSMNKTNLNKNSLGLDGKTIVSMAHNLINKLS